MKIKGKKEIEDVEKYFPRLRDLNPGDIFYLAPSTGRVGPYILTSFFPPGYGHEAIIVNLETGEGEVGFPGYNVRPLVTTMIVEDQK